VFTAFSLPGNPENKMLFLLIFRGILYILTLAGFPERTPGL